MDPASNRSAPIDYASPPALRPGAVVVRHDKRMGMIVAVGGAFALGVGVYSRLYPGFLNQWWSFVFGGVAVLLGLWLLLDSRPKLIIGVESFHDHTSGFGELWWNQIAGVRLGFYDGPYLYIKLRDPALASGKLAAQGEWRHPRATDPRLMRSPSR